MNTNLLATTSLLLSFSPDFLAIFPNLEMLRTAFAFLIYSLGFEPYKELKNR
jgi:hypothetical protein